MTDLNEDEIVREIDRDVSDKGSLVVLIFCLLTVVALLVAGASAFVNAS